MSYSLNIQLESGKKLYFASDIHFGEPDYETSRAREQKLLRWLHQIEKDAQAIFFVGDTFDFWFEYSTVVPKGYIRFFSKVIHLIENGIPVYFFTGNHDLWMKDYLEVELGATVFKDKVALQVNERKIFLAHGDGLGPGDTKYKLLKKVFTNPVCKWLFKWLHPDIGIKIATAWSRKSRGGHSIDRFKGIDKEWTFLYAKKKLETTHFDYFIFGHRHIPMEYSITEQSKFVNLGDWIVNDTFGVFDGNILDLKQFESD